jgi:hypothetical protein
MKAIPEAHNKVDIYVFTFFLCWSKIQDGHQHRSCVFSKRLNLIEQKLYMNDDYIVDRKSVELIIVCEINSRKCGFEACDSMRPDLTEVNDCFIATFFLLMMQVYWRTIKYKFQSLFWYNLDSTHGRNLNMTNRDFWNSSDQSGHFVFAWSQYCYVIYITLSIITPSQVI